MRPGRPLCALPHPPPLLAPLIVHACIIRQKGPRWLPAVDVAQVGFKGALGFTNQPAKVQFAPQCLFDHEKNVNRLIKIGKLVYAKAFTA